MIKMNFTDVGLFISGFIIMYLFINFIKVYGLTKKGLKEFINDWKSLFKYIKEQIKKNLPQEDDTFKW